VNATAARKVGQRNDAASQPPSRRQPGCAAISACASASASSGGRGRVRRLRRFLVDLVLAEVLDVGQQRRAVVLAAVVAAFGRDDRAHLVGRDRAVLGIASGGERLVALPLLEFVGGDAGEDLVGLHVVAALVGEVDLAEALLLDRAQVTLLHHLQQRDQRPDQPVAALGAVEDLGEADLPARLELVEQPARVEPDVALLLLDLHRRLLPDLLQQLGERRRQVPDADLAEFEVVLVGLLGEVRRLRQHQRRLARAAVGARIELAREVAVALVLQQAADQVVARIELLLQLDRLVGQQLARLDLHQRARHHEEVADVVQVERAQHREVLEVVVEDARDADLVDVELRLPHEVQQQVHGAREDRELDAIAHGGGG
jgi:hypothetical protein